MTAFADCARRSGVLWLSPHPGEPGRLVWHAWSGDAAFVLTGPGEQEVPGLVEVATAGGLVEAVVRDPRERGVAHRAHLTATVVPPDSEEWTRLLPLLLGKRLNLSDPASAPARWASGTLVRLAEAGAQPR